jgi:UDP-N-acetylglucosamine--N-acetylmuramyl-(pentapeptide) pyrophosphoryl-undecaprenol N-acetylglucosamine transferase
MRAGVQVLHAVGHGHDPVVVADARVPYVTVSYLDRIEQGYAAADLVLCRAGAITCAELAAVGLPAVFVPLPHGNGEQRLNAAPLVEAEAGVLVDDDELTGAWISEHVPALVADETRLAAMSAAAATLGRRDADELLARMVQRAAAGLRVTGGSW